MQTWQVVLVAGGIPLALGLVFLSIGLLRARMIRGWTRTTGVVVDRRTGRTDGGLRAIHPTFRWQDERGATHQHTSSFRQSLGPAPGTQVPVLYDPAVPSRGAIDSVVQNGGLFTAIGWGLVALGLSVGVLLAVVLGTAGSP